MRAEETFTCLLHAQQQLHQDVSSVVVPWKQEASIPSICCDLFSDPSSFFPSQLLPVEGLFPSPSIALELFSFSWWMSSALGQQPWRVGAMAQIYPWDRVEPAKMGYFKLCGDKPFFPPFLFPEDSWGSLLCQRLGMWFFSSSSPFKTERENFMLWNVLIGEHKSKL